MREEIRQYILKRRKEGFSDSSIRKRFLESGYSPSAVDGFFSEFSEPVAPEKSASEGASQPPPAAGPADPERRRGPPGWLGWLLLAGFAATLVALLWQLDILF